jgi:hypothetical protein
MMTPFVPPPWLAALLTRDKFLRLAIELLSRLIVVLYRLQRVPVWRSFDGRVTPIARMRDTHLVNTLAMLIRRRERPAAFLFLHREVERRGLGHMVDSAVDRGQARPWSPRIWSASPGAWGDQ